MITDASQPSNGKTARPTGAAWPIALLVAATAAPYAPLFFGQVLYNRDIARWLYPARAFVRAAYDRCEAPWWNPDVGLGFPVMADPLYGLFYVPNLLHLVGPLPLMVMLSMLAHLIAGGLGVFCLGRALCLDRWPSAVAGLAWALSGHTTSLWTIGVLLPAAAWIPWFGVAFVDLARAVEERRASFRPVVWASLVTGGSLLLGEVFLSIMGVGFGLGTAAAFLLVSRRASGTGAAEGAARLHLRFFAGCAVALLLGLALSMASLWPAIAARGATERAAALPAGYAEEWSLHPFRLLELGVRGAFADAWEASPDAPWAKTVLDGRPFSMSVYLGGSVLGLVLLAFRAPGRRRDEASPRSREHAFLAWSLFALAAAALLLALGRHTPVHGLVRGIVPPLGYQRTPEKYLVLAVPWLAILAGLGAQRLLRSGRPPWRRGAVLVGLLAAVAAVSSPLLPEDLGGYVRRGAIHGGGAAALVLAAIAMRRRSFRWAAFGLVAVVFADLALNAVALLRLAPDRQLTEPPPAAAAIRRGREASLRPAPRLFRSPVLQDSVARNPGASRERISLDTLRDNTSVPFGIAVLPGYEPGLSMELRDVLASGRRAALRLLAVDYAFLSARKGETSPSPDLASVFDGIAGARLYRVVHPLPRVFLAQRIERRAADRLNAHLLDDDVVSGRTALLEPDAPVPAMDGPRADRGACVLERFGNTRLAATCRSDRPGLVVFVEQFAAGWSATVDGVPAPVIRTNLLMRGVPMPLGRHRIALSFSPPGLGAGCLLSGIGVAGCLLLLLVRRRPA